MKKLLGIVVVSGALATVASATTSHGLHVSPATVHRGHVVRVYGSVGNGCQTGRGTAVVYSYAFARATRKRFAGMPAFYANTARNGHFSFRVRIRRSVPFGRYHVGGRCGGGNFGAATLMVLR